MRSRPALLASLIAVALVAVVGTVGWRWYSTERDREAGSKAALAAYVKGWNAKTMTGVRQRGVPGPRWADGDRPADRRLDPAR